MATYEVFDLGPPMPQGPEGQHVYEAEVLALNEKGQTAGISRYVSPPHPTLNERGAVATFWNRLSGGILLESPGVTSWATGINDGGSVVGGFAPALKNPYGEPDGWMRHGFVYHNGSMIDLRPILGTEFSTANDINNAGKVVGSAGEGGQRVPFVYDVAAGSSPLFPLGNPPGDKWIQWASSINNHGAVVGVTDVGSPPQSRGFLYTGDGLIYLGTEVTVNIAGISDSGLIAGDIRQGDYFVAAVYDTNDSQPKFEPIGRLPGHDTSYAQSINDKGEMVGSSFVSQDQYAPPRGFLYQDGVMNDLNDLIPSSPGWVLGTGIAINNAGEIAARGSYNGQPRSCLLVPSIVFGVTNWENKLIWYILRGVIDDTPGVVYPPGGPPIPVDPGWRHRLDSNKQDVLSGLAVNQMASLIKDPDVRRHVEEAGIRVIEESVRKLKEGS